MVGKTNKQTKLHPAPSCSSLPAPWAQTKSLPEPVSSGTPLPEHISSPLQRTNMPIRNTKAPGHGTEEVPTRDDVNKAPALDDLNKAPALDDVNKAPALDDMNKAPAPDDVTPRNHVKYVIQTLKIQDPAKPTDYLS